MRLREHNYLVTFNGLSYPSLPRGEHGQGDPEIQVGKVRQMIRQLEIDMDCARRHLQILQG